MTDDFVLNEESDSLNELISYHLELIEGLKKALSEATQSVEIELGLLRELTEAIIHLRELRQMQFQMRHFSGRFEPGKSYEGVGAIVDAIADDRLEAKRL